MTNLLAQESSPYLLQHKDNPVDWFPWGDEAFRVAHERDMPILLSVGYAACHWCHVMEHESFEDPATAKLMNEHFICVKVDREERPDVDSIYMDAVQAMTGHGGWPMTVFLTPDGKPFFGGTYFPPEDRHGMPSFRKLLLAVAEAWRERRSDVDRQSDQLVESLGVATRLRPSRDLLTRDDLSRALTQLRLTFDEEHGGFGGAPKFPQPMTIDLLLRLSRNGNREAGGMAEKTLDAMAAGGIFDQLGGGFHRYSVDRYWVVPHFEKMLYDNAQLVRTYARSFAATGNELHRRVAEATVEWLMREMRDEAGGFWSSLDADSEGEEGKFYVWTHAEVLEAAGPDSEVAIERWGFTSSGNFEGKNIPVLAATPEDSTAVERARRALLERRSARVRPETDTKVLAGWTSLTASALAEAGNLLGRSDWIEAGRDALQFVLDEMRVDGRLMRAYREMPDTKTVRHLAYCEDYAFVLEACLALFEATHEWRWLDEARWAADETVSLFLDPEAGGFFTTGSDAQQLVLRPKEVMDNAIPCANSVLALELQRLALITGNATYEKHALGAIRLVKDAAVRSPQGFGHLLQAVDFYTATPLEIVVLGDPNEESTDALLETINSAFLPNKVVIATDELSEHKVEAAPLLRDRAQIDGRPTAFVCQHGTCKLPVTEPAELKSQLASAAPATS